MASRMAVSGVILTCILFTLPTPLSASRMMAGSEDPPILEAPEPRPVRINSLQRIYFDLETTGFGTDAQIIQLAAVAPDDVINLHVMPTVPVPSRVSKVTGIQVRGGVMTQHGEAVEAITIHDALQKLLDFIGARKALLIGHNSRTFDSRILVNVAEKIGMADAIKLKVAGFLDTLRLFKQLYPQSPTHRQEHLYTNIVGGSYLAHDALADVKALKELVDAEDLSDEVLERHTFSTNYVSASLHYLKVKNQNKVTLAPLRDLISSGMLDKIAGSGLTLDDLRTAYWRDGGVRSLFTQVRSGGGARVTRTSSIIDNVDRFFAEE